MKTLIIDNYDSFTYNLYQLVGLITKEKPKVVLNNLFNWKDFLSWNVDKVIISPGPGRPDNKADFGMSAEVISKTDVPVLGICLGHQGIGNIFGAKIIEAPEIMHGRVSRIFHTERGIFKGIPQGFSAVRYHSFVLYPSSLPDVLEMTAWTEEKVIMGLAHKAKPQWGIQFHPESIGTQFGRKLLENFLFINYEKSL